MSSQSSNAIEFSFERATSIPDNSTLESIARENGAVEEALPVGTPPAVTKPYDDASPALEDGTPAEQDAKPATPQPEESPKVHKITVDGQELLVTEKDLLEGHMRHRDYTQKTQRIADKEREFSAREARYTQELQTIDNFLRDPAAVQAYVEKAFGQQMAQQAHQRTVQSIDPNQPITAAQANDIARYNADQVRYETQQAVQAQLMEAHQAAQSVQIAAQREKVEATIDSHVESLLSKYPVLRKFDGIEEVLMADAQKSGPVTSLDDAKAKLADAAGRRAAIIKAIADDDKKANAVAAAKLKAGSPEPQGGSAPRPKAGKALSLDYKDNKARIDSGVELVQSWLNEQG